MRGEEDNWRSWPCWGRFLLFVGGPVAVAQEIRQRQIDGVVPGGREGGQNAHVIHTKKLGIPGAESEGRATASTASRAELIQGAKDKGGGQGRSLSGAGGMGGGQGAHNLQSMVAAELRRKRE